MIVARTGNEAMAEAMRQINPDVVAAYPITPATEVVQLFSKFVHDGLVDTEFVPVESEHSACSACCGAAAAGARVMTSTASQGLALMHEILFIASGLRLPIVICLVNRSLSSRCWLRKDGATRRTVRGRRPGFAARWSTMSSCWSRLRQTRRCWRAWCRGMKLPCGSSTTVNRRISDLSRTSCNCSDFLSGRKV